MDNATAPAAGDGGFIPAAMVAPLTRIGERVAAIEARSTAEIAALKRDTEVIRTAMHDANNNMQLFVAAERQCAANLASLTLQMAGHNEQLSRVTKAVRDLSEDRTRAEGAWWAAGKIALALGLVLSGIAAAATAAMWFVRHVTVTP